MIGVGAVAGIALAVIAVSAFSSRSPAQPDNIGPSAQTANEKPSEEEPKTQPPQQEPKENKNVVDSPKIEETATPDSGPSTDPPEVPTDPATKQVDQERNPTQQDPTAALPSDPDIPPGLIAQNDAEPSSDTKPEDANDLTAGLGKFADFLEDDSFRDESDPTTDTVDEVLAPESLPRPAARRVNLKARLQDSIEEIEFANVALIDFAQFITDFSTIPVTLDADGIAWAKQSPTIKLSVQARNTTVEGLLNTALQPHGLQYLSVDNNQIVITRRSKHHSGLRTVTHPVDDLAEDEQELALLRSWLVALIEPASWSDVGGPGTDPRRRSQIDRRTARDHSVKDP